LTGIKDGYAFHVAGELPWQAVSSDTWTAYAVCCPFATALKELRPGSRGRSEVRILFVFDPWRSAILLVAGDKAGSWHKWYARMIPPAEQLYA